MLVVLGLVLWCDDGCWCWCFYVVVEVEVWVWWLVVVGVLASYLYVVLWVVY